MSEPYALAEIEQLDRCWGNKFATECEHELWTLSEPVYQLGVFLEELHQVGNSVLDAGCGWGRYVYRFLDEEVDYLGLDHADKLLALARKHNPNAKFVEGSVTDMRMFPDEQFDGIWSCCVLTAFPKQHLPAILAEHHRVLRPGGIMMIVLPQHWHPSEGMVTEDDEPAHYHANYNLSEFRGYTNDAGFMVMTAECREFEGAFHTLLQKPVH